MDWLKELELVQLLRTVMVSVDETWDIAGVRLDAVYFLVLLCGFSILSYCLDIYHLVKRKTMTETMIGMLLPGMAALSGAVWLTEYGSLPSGQVLERLAGQPFSLALSVQFLLCAVLFAIVFAMTRLCWKNKRQEESGRTGTQEEKKRERIKYPAASNGVSSLQRCRAAGGFAPRGIRQVSLLTLCSCKHGTWLIARGNKKTGKAQWRWIAAYALEFLTALMAFAAGSYGVFTNEVLHRERNLFAGCSVLYGIFLYLLPLLLFKIVLLLLLALLRAYGARITVFPYRQGMHAGRYLYRWLLLYRCPLLREVVVFALVTGLLLLKVSGEVPREDALMAASIFGILTAGYLWAAVRRSTEPLRKSLKNLKEQFCREYFCEAPVVRNEEYTLTPNFLVDEKHFTDIFYLGDMLYVPRGWINDGKKWLRVITFRDGSRVSLEKGKRHDEEIFRGIERYAVSYGIAGSKAMADGGVKTHKAYIDTIKGQLLAVWTVVMMLVLTVVLMDGLGAW